jgi:DNA modification methylase
VLDPFAGSGTALVESALLGLESVGFDLDPLSVLIAGAKLQGLRAAPAELAEQADRARAALASRKPSPTPDLQFPDWLTKNRRFTPEVAAPLAREIGDVRAVLSACDPRWLGFFRVLVSDAMSRRIRMRLLGTGVGRFSLTISASTLTQFLHKALERTVRVAAACAWLRETLRLNLASSRVAIGDARCLSDAARRCDILVTSPPYLPAASGRESYAKARVLSFLALGMLEREGVDALVSAAIGSMDGEPADLGNLSAAEREVVAWLRADSLRAIKAEPTARYFLDLHAVFAQMRRVLEPGGIAVVVCGRQSTFYQFATRRALYVVESAKLLAESAAAAGLEVEELLDVQLVKSNMNARPRALDAYYETLVFLRRAT